MPSVEEIRSPVRALEAASRAISSELDLDRVLQLIADSVRRLVDARYAALGIVGDDGRIERFITSGISPEVRAAIGPLPEGHGLLGTIIRDGVTLRIPDIAKHPETFGFPPNHPPMHSLLGVPVRVDGRPIGNFYLTEKQGATAFSQDDEDLVELFALHAAIAIQHARLHARVRELALVDERLRISRDLHDGIIQSIYAVSLSLEEVAELIGQDAGQAADRVDRAIDRLNATILDLRTFIAGLAGSPDRPSLAEALEAAAAEVVGQADLEFSMDLEIDDAVAERLAPEIQHELVQVAREALSNVVRHSGARRASLRLAIDGGDLVLAIEDDGQGFDPAVRIGQGHFGLPNIRDRAVTIGGGALIESAPGTGTRIIVRLPIPPGAMSDR